MRGQCAPLDARKTRARIVLQGFFSRASAPARCPGPCSMRAGRMSAGAHRPVLDARPPLDARQPSARARAGTGHPASLDAPPLDASPPADGSP
jgi:hypothetical protein